MLPIDRSAKTTLDINLSNGKLSDAPTLRASDDIVYNTIDELYNFTTGLISAGTMSRLGIINVKDYNASGLATIATGSITSGTKVLTLTTTPDFVAGQGIAIPGAGVAAATLITTVSSISGLVVTVADAASTTATSVTVTHDDRAVLNTLFNTTLTTSANVLMPAGTYILNANLTIPSYINLIMMNGAMLSPITGKTVTINGEVQAGLYQIFTGAGTIIGTPRAERFYPEWWGAKGDGSTDDIATIQATLTSLIGRTAKVVFTSSLAYAISNTLIICDTLELEGVLSTRYGKVGSDVPTTVLKWIGATNGTMLKYLKASTTLVRGSKICNITFDANSVAGVTCINMTNSKSGLIEDCNFTQMVNGIYLDNTYYNIIHRNTFGYFTGTGINVDLTVGVANDNTISENYFALSNASSIGVRVKGANSTKIVMNRFEGYAASIQPIYIEGANALDTTISLNRFEHQWILSSSQTPVYAITIKNVGGRPSNTKIIGNQYYLEETISATTYYNYSYVLLDEGYNTICDEFVNDNFLPNGCFKQFNGATPIWKSSNAAYTISYDATEDATKLTVASSAIKYPAIYNIISAKQFRNRNCVVSVLFKCTNITTTPQVEVQCYKTGDGTFSNLGTYISSQASSLASYKAGDYMLLTSPIAIPSDVDHIYVNVNPNGNNTAFPADNTIFVKFIAISDLRCFKVNPNRDLVMDHIRMVYTTSNLPAATAGMVAIDSTMNKLAWHDGTNWNKSGRYVSVPASATATGLIGDYSADASYAYFCYAVNTWHKVAIATW